jgi:adenylylsulfate kinase-like enzyme
MAEPESGLGTCYWITGLSGAGKTTLGHAYYQHLREQGRDNLVYLDGDTLREVFGNHLGHSPAERHQLAMSYARMCRMLTEQGIDVICATISMFDEVRAWNRDNIEHYVEVYLDVPIEVLKKRDQKQLYSRALRGEIKHVMGIDEPVALPVSPDIVIVNDGSLTKPQLLDRLLNEIANLDETR